MKTKDLMDAWNEIDEKYLSEAERRQKQRKKTQGRKRLAVLLTAAALLTIGIALGTFFIIRNFTNKPGMTAVQPDSGTELTDEKPTDAAELTSSAPDESEELTGSDEHSEEEEIKAVISSYFELLIHIQHDGDREPEAIKEVLDMSEIECQNTLTALQRIVFVNRYMDYLENELSAVSTLVGPEMRSDAVPYENEFQYLDCISETECSVRILQHLKSGYTYPNGFSAETHEFLMRRMDEGWKIARHSWSGYQSFEYSSTDLYSWDEESEIIRVRSWYNLPEEESRAEGESDTSDIPEGNFDHTDFLPRTPFEGIHFGMTAAEITEILGPADENLGTEGVDTVLHYIKSLDSGFGMTVDLYLSVLEYSPDGKAIGLYRIDGSFGETDLKALDEQVQKYYGPWDEVIHDENTESQARIVDGKLTHMEGLQAYQYMYSKWNTAGLNQEKKDALKAFIRTMNESYWEKEGQAAVEIDDPADLVSINAKGIEGERGIAFSIDALYCLALLQAE